MRDLTVISKMSCKPRRALAMDREYRRVLKAERSVAEVLRNCVKDGRKKKRKRTK